MARGFNICPLLHSLFTTRSTERRRRRRWWRIPEWWGTWWRWLWERSHRLHQWSEGQESEIILIVLKYWDRNTDHCGGGGVGVGSQGGGDSAAVWSDCAGWWDWSYLYRSSGEDDGQSEGWDDDAGGEEVGQLPAGVAGAVVAVSPSQHAGDGTEQVEDDDCEGIPVTANININLTSSLSLSPSLSYLNWGKAQARKRNISPIDPVNARPTRAENI